MSLGVVDHFSQTLATLVRVNPPTKIKPLNTLSTSAATAQAMLLAAGRGERMRPLTDSTPKPLLQVQGKPLMQWPLEAMARAGLQQVLINTAWLGEQIESAFGGHFTPVVEPRMGADALDATTVHLLYSNEGRDFGGALETAGGIVRALPLLDAVFWVAAGDVFAPEFVFAADAFEQFKASPFLAHIWLVPNPAHNPQGDFGLSAEGLALNTAKPISGAETPTPVTPTYTFSTIALYKRAFFEADWCPIPAGNPKGVKAPLAAMLRAAMDRGLVSASLYEGLWVDVGTPERLAQLNA